MRVVCDNCGAVYKIPESKLQREVNKATCRKCGHGIIIRKMGSGALSIVPEPADGEATQITSADELEARARAQQTAAAGMPSIGFPPFGGRDMALEDVIPPTVVEQRPDSHEQTVPRAGRGAPGPIIESPSRPMPASPPPSLPPPMAAAGQTLIPMSSPMPSPMSGQATPPSPMPPMPSQPAPMLALPPVHAPAPPFDPSGDMTLVMMGCFGGLVGSAVLATATGDLVGAIGLAICVGSALTSLLVLVTGDRGRKEARVFLSMLMALFLAGGAGGAWYALAAAKAGLLGQLASFELPVEGPRAALPVEAPADVVDEAPEAPKDDVLAELTATDTGVEPKEPKGEPNGEPKTQPTAVVRTSPEPKTEPKTQPKTQPKTEPKTQPKTTSGTQGVPVTVLDTMLKSNKGVKRCFGIYRQETGALPSGRITVELTVQPSGKATHAKIDGGAYAGTSLDSCLSGAIKDITFPPWDGSEGLTYYYPFIMN